MISALRDRAALALRRRGARPPDVVIGDAAFPYLRRWHLIPRNRVFNVYLHHFCRSDDDRALHDHPWWNMSWLLDGTYLEHKTDGVYARRQGDVVFRGGRAPHRIQLLQSLYGREKPVWTLFITGPRFRAWGFHCKAGWRPWQEFTTPDGKGVGPGCGP